jgi:hypothetical protein
MFPPMEASQTSVQKAGSCGPDLAALRPLSLPKDQTARSRSHSRKALLFVRESALEADIARFSILVDDHPHRDAAGRADRRAVIGVGLAGLFHAGTLAGGPEPGIRPPLS